MEVFAVDCAWMWGNVTKRKIRHGNHRNGKAGVRSCVPGDGAVYAHNRLPHKEKRCSSRTAVQLATNTDDTYMSERKDARMLHKVSLSVDREERGEDRRENLRGATKLGDNFRRRSNFSHC